MSSEPKTKVVTGTWRCRSGYLNAQGEWVWRYDSGEQSYTRRVPVLEVVGPAASDTPAAPME